MYSAVSALTGISVSFAPLFLYLTGKGTFHLGPDWIVIPLCFAVIFLVPSFYFRLGDEVIKALRQESK